MVIVDICLCTFVNLVLKESIPPVCPHTFVLLKLRDGVSSLHELTVKKQPDENCYRISCMKHTTQWRVHYFVCPIRVIFFLNSGPTRRMSGFFVE